MLREPMSRLEIDDINDAVRLYAISVADRASLAALFSVTTETVTRWFSPGIVEPRPAIPLSFENVEFWQKDRGVRRREIMGRIVAGGGMMDVATVATADEHLDARRIFVNDLGAAVTQLEAVVHGDYDSWFAVGCSRLHLIALGTGGYEINIYWRNSNPAKDPSPTAVGELGGPQAGIPGDPDFRAEVSPDDF